LKTVYPNLVVSTMVRDNCQEIINVLSTRAPSPTEGAWTPATSDAYAYGYAKGAFDAMSRGGSSLTADFAKFVLVPIALEGADYVKHTLVDLTEDDNR
jgi:hypothetical protein